MSNPPITTINVIESVYTKDIMYTTRSEDATIGIYKTVIYNCKFTRSAFGSIYVKCPIYDNVIELYPNSITHILHREETIIY